MLKIIIYIFIILLTIHFIMYYFNCDFNYLKSQFQIQNKEIKSNINSNQTQNDSINSNSGIEIKSEINESINKLKTLNECINNGKIDTIIP
jgi:hypothetical protein